MITSLERDPFLAIIACIDREKPSKKSRKESTQGAVAILRGKKKVQVCVSQSSDPKKSLPRKAGQTRLNASAGHTIKFSRRAWYAIQIWEIKGPSRGVIQKGEPHERNPCAPKLRKEHLRKPQDKKNVPAKQHPGIVIQILSSLSLCKWTLFWDVLT